MPGNEGIVAVATMTLAAEAIAEATMKAARQLRGLAAEPGDRLMTSGCEGRGRQLVNIDVYTNDECYRKTSAFVPYY